MLSEIRNFVLEMQRNYVTILQRQNYLMVRFLIHCTRGSHTLVYDEKLRYPKI